MNGNPTIDILHIAKLARIKIANDEIEKFAAEMNDMIRSIEAMPNIDDELLIDAGDAMTLREDRLSEGGLSRDELLKNAPKVVAGCVVVPKTVE